MASGFDVLLGNTAVERGLVPRDRLAAGGDGPLADRLVDLGLITLDQREALLGLFESPLGPDAIPGYRLEAAVGRGAMGTVYRALDASGRPVAIKVLSPSLARDKAMAQRFLREAETARRLEHPNAARGLGGGEAAGTHYLVLEYVPGGTLLDRIRAEGPLPEAEALELLEKTAGALGAAHALGIVHRDVKPANLLLGPDGPKLADFGLARDVLSPGLTATAGFLGTPYYCSPEQAEGRPLDGRADFYSLGATMYHAVTGSVPFEGESAVSIAVKHVGRTAPTPSSRGAKVSPAFEALLAKLMAKDPAARPRDAAELLADVAAVRQGRRPSRRMRHPWRDAAAVAAIAAVALLAARALTPPEPEPWLRGAVERLDGGRTRVVYEFDRPGELADFRPARLGDALSVEGGALHIPAFASAWHVRRWDGDAEVELELPAGSDLRMLLALNPGGIADFRAIFSAEGWMQIQLAGTGRQVDRISAAGWKVGAPNVVQFRKSGRAIAFAVNGVRTDLGRMGERFPVSDRLYFGLEGAPAAPQRGSAARAGRIAVTGTPEERPHP